MFEKYRVSYEAGYTRATKEQYAYVPCGRGGTGQIYAHGSKLLAFTGSGTGLRKRLLAAGCAAWQTGDEEFTVTFPHLLLKAVAKIARPHRARGPKKAGKTRVLGSNSGDLGVQTPPDGVA